MNSRSFSRFIGVILLAGVGWISTLGAAGAQTPAGAVPLPLSVIAYPNLASLGHAENAIAYAQVPLNLAAYGYFEQEYQVAGIARVFGYAAGTGNAVTVLRSGPYISRMLVRAPGNPANFSGNVIIELFNDALAGDLATTFPQAQAHILRNGDIWIGVTANSNAIALLHKFNPTRYGPLSWANPDPGRNAQTCPTNPTSTTEDGFVYDILSETAALIRSNSASNPLASYNVKAVYAAGYSGSAETVLTYVDAIEPTLATAPFDGYMISAGLYREDLNECSPSNEYESRSLVPSSSRAAVFQVQTPSEVNVFSVFSLGSQFPKQADSDGANNRYRFYEIAGTSHVDQTLVNGSPQNADILTEVGSTVGRLTAGCFQLGKVNTFPDGYVYDNLWAKLESWVRTGTLPPHAPPFGVGFDLFGNQIGGVRSPAVDVPVASYLSGSEVPLVSTVDNGAVILPCPFLGYAIGALPPTLLLRYGFRQNYVAEVTNDATALVASGFLEQPDAEAIIAAAPTAQLFLP